MHAKSLAPNETNVFNMCANEDCCWWVQNVASVVIACNKIKFTTTDTYTHTGDIRKTEVVIRYNARKKEPIPK